MIRRVTRLRNPGALAIALCPVLFPGGSRLSMETGLEHQGNGEPAVTRVLSVTDAGVLVMDGRLRVSLQGLDLPPRGNSGRGRPLARIRSLALDRSFRVQSDGPDPDRPGTLAGVLSPPGATVPSLNEQLLAEGLCFFRTRTKKVERQAALLRASMEARQKGLGVWRDTPRTEGEPPVQRGGVLGLYYKEERYDYHAQLERVRDIGADWVLLVLSALVDKVDSNEIELDAKRTVPDRRLRETIAHAKMLGLRVALMPIVLIRHPGEDDWRGTLRPTDPGRFWLNYESFLRRYLDIARESGVELFSVGSELCSLEKHTETWRRIIQNARGRYGGWLTYSVNWDHYDEPEFWDLLDQLSMTAYFELTKDKDAGLAELEKGWQKVHAELEAAARRLGRPIVLTELGYASQDGTNTAPWNYYLAPDKLDLEEQADCFRAFVSVMGDAPFVASVYVFDFFEQGGPKDTTYALHGKPAWKVVRRFFAGFRR
ncbi:MAG: hypothetical protein ACE5F1_14610 [Planctomycetota bacterium]